MTILVLAHLVAAALAPTLVRMMGTRSFYALAVVPAVTAGWAAVQTSRVGADAPVFEQLTWVPALGLELTFRLDTLAWLMTLVVSVVGALVLLYCAHYFDTRQDSADVAGLGLFGGSLVAFAGAMLGLVTADDLLLLYVFWELTTVLSYLLIGYLITKRASTAAAKQALVVTTLGGLAMLVGVVILGESYETYRVSRVVEQAQATDWAVGDPSGGWVTAGVVLLLVGAITKSALVPFHFWLPGAMAAPTPVSAYLHAAAMVKAGVYLVARFAPAYAGMPVWQWLVLGLGTATMLLGGYRSLRQYDLKLLLAYGTVSQLGFITVLVGRGTEGATLAGLTLLLAHALFKSSLFLTVGTIDHAAGTRDLRRLTGIRRRLPWLTAGAVAAVLSMAGLPPVLGFVAKEAAFTSLQPGPGQWFGPDGLVLAVIVAGSVITFGYSTRFLWGAFADRTVSAEGAERPLHEPLPQWHRPGPLLVAVPVALGAAGLAAGLTSTVLEPTLASYAGRLPVGPYETHLGLWHGITPALLLSLATWVLGGLLFLARAPVARLQHRLRFPLDAGRAYHSAVRGVERGALELTGLLQRGSLPSTLATILVVFVVLPGVVLLRGVSWPEEVRPWDSVAQPAVAVGVVVAAVAAARARRRFRAVFLVGVTGYGLALLFLLHGAPDLALTQVLVETVALVVFVLVVRRLSGRFPDDPSVLTRRMRVVLGVGVGAVVAGAALTASAARNLPPAGEGLMETAKDYGGGANIVNVILVDVRAWDTMGELSVVLAAATGVASLVFLRQDNVSRVQEQLLRSRRSRMGLRRPAGLETRWIVAAERLEPQRRSTIFEVVTRLIFHTIVLWSLYLLFSGHNNPGGGFAAGLVAGLALALRYLAGRGYELRVAAPVMPGLLLGSGLFIAAGSAVLPMLVGSPALRTWIVDVQLPLLGELHLVTSLLFDVGVYLVVIGLILDILRSLGSALDEQVQAETDDDRPAPTTSGGVHR